MTQQDIIEMMRAPERIAPGKITELYEFLREYPYSHTFRVLYLRALCNAGDFRYDAECGMASIYAGDREVLAEQMEKKYLPQEEVAGKDEDASQASILTKEDNRSVTAPMTDIISELEKLDNLPLPAKKKNNKKHQGLIDDFLKKSESGAVTINSPKESDNQQVEDKTSGQGREEFYTETLAKIYIKQKKYDLAVKIFRRLMLKNSEKSVYFADQVRFLERLMDNL